LHPRRDRRPAGDRGRNLEESSVRCARRAQANARRRRRSHAMNDRPEYPADDDLRGLPGAEQPPAALEERLVAALRVWALLSPSPARRLWLVAAALLCFGGGWLGRAQTAAHDAAEGRPLYVLLLSPLPQRADPATEAGLVEEYRAWAVSLRRQNRLVR